MNGLILTCVYFVVRFLHNINIIDLPKIATNFSFLIVILTLGEQFHVNYLSSNGNTLVMVKHWLYMYS